MCLIVGKYGTLGHLGSIATALYLLLAHVLNQYQYSVILLAKPKVVAPLLLQKHNIGLSQRNIP